MIGQYREIQMEGNTVIGQIGEIQIGTKRLASLDN